MRKVKVSELVALLENETEDKQRELAEVRATMLANFGSDKRKPKILNDSKDSATAMFVKIIQYYQAKLKKIEK